MSYRHDAAGMGRELLHARALIHRARQRGETVIPVGDLLAAVGDPEDKTPNSITEWSRQGQLDELIRELESINPRWRGGEVI